MSAFFTDISMYMFGTNELQIYTVYTLVDITDTGITRYTDQVAKQRNQQRNWETVLQAFGLRSLPVVVEVSILNNQSMDQFKFGKNYAGTHTVWVAKIGIETADVYKKSSDPVALLCEDFNQVPIITGLDETAEFPHKTFACAGPSKNIYFILS